MSPSRPCCFDSLGPQFVRQGLRDQRSKRDSALGGHRFGAAKDGIGNFESTLHEIHGPIFMGVGQLARKAAVDNVPRVCR